MCVLEGFRFKKCVFTSRTEFSLNLVPLYTTVSKNTVSVSDISAVNLIVQIFTSVFYRPVFLSAK